MDPRFPRPQIEGCGVDIGRSLVGSEFGLYFVQVRVDFLFQNSRLSAVNSDPLSSHTSRQNPWLHTVQQSSDRCLVRFHPPM